MANFDLNKYATVAERLAQFHIDHPDGRIITENLTTLQDRQVSTWVVKTTIYLSAEDQAANLPKSTGLAFEVDGQGMANKTSALENAESSSIGRALMVMGYAMSKEPNALASREEMEKVQRGVTPKPTTMTAAEVKKKIDAAILNADIDGLRSLYNEARKSGASDDLLELIRKAGDGIGGQKNSDGKHP